MPVRLSAEQPVCRRPSLRERRNLSPSKGDTFTKFHQLYFVEMSCHYCCLQDRYNYHRKSRTSQTSSTLMNFVVTAATSQWRFIRSSTPDMILELSTLRHLPRFQICPNVVTNFITALSAFRCVSKEKFPFLNCLRLLISQYLRRTINVLDLDILLCQS